ncbi:MAG: FAD-dependent oxidoreductase [Candidatus Omnitrophica bacterium]|nr:FAD-dependent oxidoreductase [Candidatus Omnitrophota bacterium]
MRAGIFTTTIEDVQDIGIQDTRLFRLSFPAGTLFEFEAGQFLNIMIPTPEKTVKRSYSIASPPQWTAQGRLDLCWKRVPGGFATAYLWDLKKGDKLEIQGPLGRFTARKPLPAKIVFISTGTGIAPFRSMIHDLLDRKESLEIWNLFGNRYEEDILYKEEFENLAREHSNFKNVFTVSRPKTWAGETAYVQNLLKKYIPVSGDTHLFICGLSAMIKEVETAALDMGFRKDQIFFEKYD